MLMEENIYRIAFIMDDVPKFTPKKRPINGGVDQIA